MVGRPRKAEKNKQDFERLERMRKLGKELDEIKSTFSMLNKRKQEVEEEIAELADKLLPKNFETYMLDVLRQK